jgi:AraC-like DNA-binding protein
MISFFYLLIILGSLQGLVTTVLLFTKRPSRKSNKLLAVIVLLIALPGIHLYGHYVSFFNNSRITNFIHACIPWISVMALGPLLYLYVRALSDSSFTVRRKEFLLFLPMVIDLFPKIMEITSYTGLLQFWTKDIFTEYIDAYNKYADLPRWLSLAYYVFLSGNALKKYGGFARISNFILAMKIFVGIWFLFLIPYLVPSLNSKLLQAVGWFPVYIPMSILIYWIGISEFYAAPAEVPLLNKKADPLSYPVQLLEQTSQRLITSMESEQLYLDPLLDLSRLSKIIGVPSKLISATVNQHLNKSFNQFLNEYRVAAFKRRLLEPGSEKITIPGLARSCGFGSPATFQRSFKQITGITPTEFMRSATEPAVNLDQIRI